jgi:hypothetical protein
MAQKVLVQLVDDLDGTTSNDISTVQFGLDGVTYEIDLTKTNAAKLRKNLEDFIASARRVGGRAKRGTAAGAPKAKTSAAGGYTREQNQAIREWAKKNGHDVSERGRIPSHIIEAFESAHGRKKKNPAA